MMVDDATKIAFFDQIRDERYGLSDLLKNWPKLPSPYFLKILGESGTYPEDSTRGIELQRELDTSIIPYKHECEMGAGFWDRITNGAWRELQTEGWINGKKT
ncbi:hypothetical protein [uncultured Roseibium sp.]|uniref:hypothetical protein n=1 Tax=uncultured Roseibium sp. TaxID=1936171 RepID=UPI002610514A|nr:hypothetical protein [uncultured Roseibium sp.]